MKKRFKNQLLTVLPPEVFARWLPHLEWVDMPLGTGETLLPGLAFLLARGSFSLPRFFFAPPLPFL